MWTELFASWRVFLTGFLGTLSVSLVAMLLMLVISLAVGIGCISSHKALRGMGKAYMRFFQNTPFLIQLFFLFHVLPLCGLTLPTFVVGSVSLALYTASFGSAVIESSIRAVPQGQTEAASSQGFGFFQSMFRVILPQAMKIALPPMTNQMINLVKNSSVLAMIAGGELMYHADSWSADHAIYGPTFVLTAVLYLSVCLPLSRLTKALEAKTRC